MPRGSARPSLYEAIGFVLEGGFAEFDDARVETIAAQSRQVRQLPTLRVSLPAPMPEQADYGFNNSRMICFSCAAM